MERSKITNLDCRRRLVLVSILRVRVHETLENESDAALIFKFTHLLKKVSVSKINHEHVLIIKDRM